MSDQTAVTQLRLAAYGVCIEDGRVLMARWTPRAYDVSNWTLPGGQVEYGEDPVDAVVREFAEETGLAVVADRLLGVDSRTIPTAERLNHGPDLHSVGIYYQVHVTGGELRPEPDQATADPSWIAIDAVPELKRSSLVDIGLALVREQPNNGHVEPIPLGGLLQH